MSEIRIDNYNPIHTGCLVAEIDITIVAWDLEIKKIKEFAKGENRWFNMPCYCDDSSGKKKFIPYVRFGFEASNQKLFSMISEKIKEMIENNPDLIPKMPEFTTEEMPF